MSLGYDSLESLEDLEPGGSGISLEPLDSRGMLEALEAREPRGVIDLREMDFRRRRST